DRRVAIIGVGQVLDQRVDRSDGRGRGEGDGEGRTDAAGKAADDGAAIGDVGPGYADLAGAAALVADRHRILGEQAGNTERTAADIPLDVGEDNAAVEQHRRRIDRDFAEAEIGGEAAQSRPIVNRGDVEGQRVG